MPCKLVIASALALGALTGTTFGQGHRIPWQSLNSGGQPCVSQNHRATSTLGQAVQGHGASASLRGFWGFWFPFAEIGIAERPAEAVPLLRVCPNPLPSGRATLHCHLPGPGIVKVRIYDALGRCAFSATKSLGHAAAGTLPLDLRSLAAGVYHARIDAGGSSTSQKLVVQK